MNLPSDLQRFLPYIAVAVLAVVGLVLVMRESARAAAVAAPSQPRSSGVARFPATATRLEGPAGRARTATAVPPVAANAPPAKRSPKAYVSCVEQATNTAALEKCQAFLP